MTTVLETDSSAEPSAPEPDSILTLKEQMEKLDGMGLVVDNDCESPPTDDEESVD